MRRLFIIILITLIPSTVKAVEVHLGVGLSGYGIECTKPEEAYKIRAKRKIQAFLGVYKPKVIQENLDRIILCGDLTLYSLTWARGTYNLNQKTIWIEADSHNDALYMLHHEFSSILFLNFKKRNIRGWLDFTRKWSSFNKEDYIRNWRLIKKNNKIDASLRDKGFLYPYSQQSLEDDFNVMSGYHLPNIDYYNQLNKKAREHYPINQKFLLLMDFYKGMLR
jgi:hypothetical protein